MRKRLTQEEFIAKAKEVHGEKYDYSKAVYLGRKYKVCIICPEHGEFWQLVGGHLQGHGCPKCKAASLRKKRYGVGRVLTDEYVYHEEAYKVWQEMLRRCYTDRFKAYRGCSICDEWLIYDNFRDWFYLRYKEGYQIDKDWIVQGNKIYSPQTCCLVPPSINSLIVNYRGRKNGLPVGVCCDKRVRKYYPKMCHDGKKTTFGGYFDTPEGAFAVYKKSKESHIRQIAEEYKNEIEPRVYEAMLRYEVKLDEE